MRHYFHYFFMYFWHLTSKFLYFFKIKILPNYIKFKNLKVAVIKPNFYFDLYNVNNNSSSIQKIIYSSPYRLGPAGLFYDLKSDFFLSNTKPTGSLIKKIKNRLHKSKGSRIIYKLQKKNSRNINNINFNIYDLIICYEGAVTDDIVNKYRKPIWALTLEDHSHRNYKKFLFFRPKPYDLFINLTQGFTLYSLFKIIHSIDFSYTFGSANLLKKLGIKNKKNIDIAIEIQQPSFVEKELSNHKYYKIYKLNGSLNLKNYLKILSKSRYFFCPIFTTPRWGNSIIEAALSQCLVIGNRLSYWNSLLIHDDLHCENLEDGLKILDMIKKNKSKYYFYLNQQNKKLNKINYLFPMNQIFEYAKKKSYLK